MKSVSQLSLHMESLISDLCLFFHVCFVCLCSLDLSVLLQKPGDREEVGGLKAVGSSQGLGHSLVFTNSHHQPARNGGTSAGSNSYTHATLVRQITNLIYESKRTLCLVI